LLRTSDDTLTPTDLALAYKQLLEVEYWFSQKFLPALESFPDLSSLVSTTPAA